MAFDQNIDGNMKFRYSLIIIDHQIDEKTSNFDQKWVSKVNFCGVHMDQYLDLCEIHHKNQLFVKIW